VANEAEPDKTEVHLASLDKGIQGFFGETTMSPALARGWCVWLRLANWGGAVQRQNHGPPEAIRANPWTLAGATGRQGCTFLLDLNLGRGNLALLGVTSCQHLESRELEQRRRSEARRQ
jgi:hypothetical protein